MAAIRDRLLAKVERHESGCWIFVGHRNENGYGILHGRSNGRPRRRYAHRVSYEEFVGQIPTDIRHEIHHICGNPSCVNPEHLECLTRSEHARLNEQSTRAACVHGHPWTPENTYISAKGHRYCRACGAAHGRAARRKRGLKGGPGVHFRERTHCPAGHPYDEENTYITPASGGRGCRICRNEASRRHRARKRLR